MTKRNRLPAPANRPPQNVSVPTQRVVTTQQFHSGPIPPPDALERYDRIVPGAAERILRMAEAQAAHAHMIESAALQSDIEARRTAQGIEKRGQIFGLVLGLASLFFGVWLALSGHDWAATTLFATCAGALVTAFLGTRKPPTPEPPKKP